jgi:hypothetical protein
MMKKRHRSRGTESDLSWQTIPLMELNDKKNHQTNSLIFVVAILNLDMFCVGGWCLPPDEHQPSVPRLSSQNATFRFDLV